MPIHDIIIMYGFIFAYGSVAFLTLLFSAYLVERTYPKSNKHW